MANLKNLIKEIYCKNIIPEKIEYVQANDKKVFCITKGEKNTSQKSAVDDLQSIKR